MACLREAPDRRFVRNSIVVLVLVVGTAALLYIFLFQGTAEKPIPYSGGESSFLGLVKDNRVESVVQQGDVLQITLREKDPETGQAKVVTSRVPSQFSTNVRDDIAAVCAEPDATCDPVPTIAAEAPAETSQWLGLLVTAVLPILLIGVFLFFMLRRAQGTNVSFGKSRPRMLSGSREDRVDVHVDHGLAGYFVRLDVELYDGQSVMVSLKNEDARNLAAELVRQATEAEELDGTG
jgi:ATP-dependent Zn protease